MRVNKKPEEYRLEVIPLIYKNTGSRKLLYQEAAEIEAIGDSAAILIGPKSGKWLNEIHDKEIPRWRPILG